MGKPVILAVDDDPQVLEAVGRDLRRRYGEDYRVVRAASGEEALTVLQELKGAGDTAAVLVVDQRMPAMSGVEFLRTARSIYPDTKRVLLTAYADTDAAIAAINEAALDHYLLKPWDPPEQNLYPIIDDLLDDWTANTPPPFDGVRVYGTRWSPPSHDARDFLARNRIPYRFFDVELDSDARAVVEAAGSARTLPVVILPDGTRLVQPDHRQLASHVGLQTEPHHPFYDLIIIGGGPAGLGAAVYGASEGLQTALIEKAATGGQAGTSSRIENYLGFPQGISGRDLARRAATQALRFGAEILTAVEVTGVRVDGPARFVTLSDGSELGCRALLIASGMTIRKLAVPGHERLVGAGIYYGAAPSEAAAFEGDHVMVVGGANSAGQAAMMLSRFAGKVTILARAASLETRMSQYLVDQICARDNIEPRVGCRVVGVDGAQHLDSVTIRNEATGVEESLPTSGLFVFVGARPHTDFLQGAVDLDPRGFVLTGPELRREGRWPGSWTLDRDPFLLETSVPGIFAAGDVRSGVVRRVASAVGQGAVAVAFVHQYLAST